MSTPLATTPAATPPANNPLERLPDAHRQQVQQMMALVAQVLKPAGINSVAFNFTQPGLPRIQLGVHPSGAPTIVLATLPKSGSLFIRNSLVRRLNMTMASVSGDFFPEDLIVPGLLKQIAGGGHVVQTHIPAHELNAALLEQYLGRVVVHVRDPRQATLSWVHHLDRLQGDADVRDRLRVVQPALPADYFDRNFEQKVQWNLDHHLPNCVRWVRDWVALSESSSRNLNVCFTTFAKMKHDPDAFFAELLGFYGVDPARLSPDDAAPDADIKKDHFRKGETDEWRRVFTPDQCAQATEAIDADLAERFDWSRDASPASVEAEALADAEIKQHAA